MTHRSSAHSPTYGNKSLTGNTLFPIAFVDDGGVKRNIPNRDAAFTFVEIWHPY